jgi:hypothetical protein
MLEKAAERFWRKVDRSGSCWLWTAACSGAGYGYFYVGSRLVGAHRYSYELRNGPIPPGMVVMHSCDVPACVNPDHLSLGTARANSADAARKARQSRGSRHYNAKLTEGQVLDLRARYARGGVTQAELAADYGVNASLVSLIVARKCWRHI